MKHRKLIVKVPVVLLLVLVLSLSMVALVAGATLTSTIDFEGLAAGTVVSSVSFGNGISGDDAGGSVGVNGVNPALAGNQAMIFDSTCGGVQANCSGGDDDLFFPGQGNMLIISEDGDSGDPDDADVVGARFEFDFSGWGTGTVTVVSITYGDVEAVEPGPSVEVFDNGSSQGVVLLPNTADNVLTTEAVGLTGDFMVVTLNGSGAIDDIQIQVEEEEPPGGEGCTPGYWKNHLEDWPPTGLDPADSFVAVFGVDLGQATLGDAIDAKGGGDKKLARHGTAALLSALHPDVNSPLTADQVIAFVQAGDADPLVAANELGCDIP